MYCPNNDFRCVDQGYCNCHDDLTAEAAGGCGELLILMVIGIFAAFLYPAIRIFRSNVEHDHDYRAKFAGAVWLFTSPLFGFLANMLYQVVFALAACTAGALQSKLTNSIYVAGTFAIYALATGLAVIAFAFKNRKVIHSLLIKAENRTGRQILILVCFGLMGLLAAFFAAGAVVTATTAYFEAKANIRQGNANEENLISNEKDKFDSYVGKYKLITRKDKISFLVSKDKNGKALRLNTVSENKNETQNSGCLLTPKIEESSVCYSVSECIVENKPSPLAKVYFRLEANKIKMDFVYNAGLSGDTLEKFK